MSDMDRRRQRLRELLAPAMQEADLDTWLVLTRENNPDPMAWDLGLDAVVGTAAGLFERRGDRVRSTALVADFDTSPVEAFGSYDQVLSYGSEGILNSLRDLLRGAGDGPVGVDFSESSPLADGLSVGLHRILYRALGPGAGARLVSAQEVVASFRSRRLPEEIEELRSMVRTTEDLVRGVLSAETIEPGRTTEKDVARTLLQRLEATGMATSWDRAHCPNVWTRQRGHGGPTDRVIRRGETLSIDFGVRRAGLCTDMQRTAYILDEGEDAPPDSVRSMWEAAVAACRAAIEVMEPGVTGEAVDTAARKALEDRGHEGYGHATGHAIGIATHEIGPLLGPDWPERYGDAVFRTLAPGQVYAVEPSAGFEVEDGRVGTGLEEMVLITPEGREVLTRFQEELILIHG